MKRNGFTLIELLVVIAIISLLVSILLPSLNKAKMMARTAVCANNLKNIGLFCHLYAYDNNGTLPPAVGLYASPNTPSWWNAIAPYVHEGTAATDIASAMKKKLVFCTERNADEFIGRWAGYCYSSSLHGSRIGGMTTRTTPFGVLGKGVNPDDSRVVMHCSWNDDYKTSQLVDSPQDGWNGSGTSKADSWYNFLSMDHNNSANFLFAGGNVRNVLDRGAGSEYAEDTNSDIKWY